MKFCPKCMKVFLHEKQLCEECKEGLVAYTDANITLKGATNTPIIISLILLVTGGFFLWIGYGQDSISCMVIGGVMVASGLFAAAISQSKEDAARAKAEKNYKIFEKDVCDEVECEIALYEQLKQRSEMPKNHYLVSVMESSVFTVKEYSEYYIWRSDNHLNFLLNPPWLNADDRLAIEKSLAETQDKTFDSHGYIKVSDIVLVRFKLSQIECFQIEGEKFIENRISGGGGGGSSLGGALVGGVIAGGVGAIIGSRKGINPISSHAVARDERTLVLTILEDEEKRSITFDVKPMNSCCSAAPEAFNELIPEKNYDIIQAKKTKELLGEEQPVSNDILAQIRELSKLKQEGILSMEEFQKKKQDLLSRV